MADVSITPANVVKGTPSSVLYLDVAGEAITAGQAVYKKAADGKWWKAQCDGSTEEASFGGIALNGAAANQPLQVQQSGQITIGGTLVVGEIYCLSATAGGIAPLADLVSTNKVVVIGYGLTSSILMIDPILTGVAKP